LASKDTDSPFLKFHLDNVWKVIGYVIPPLDFHTQAANAKAEVAKSESLISDTTQSIQQLKDSAALLGRRKESLLVLRGSLEQMETALTHEIENANQCATFVSGLAKVARSLYTKALTLSKKASIINDPGSSKRPKDALALQVLTICEKVLEGEKLGVDKEVNLILQEVVEHYGSALPDDIVAIQNRISAARSKRAPPHQHLDILGASYAGIDITPMLRHAVTEEGSKALNLGARSPLGFVNAFLQGVDPMPRVKKTLVVLYQFEGEDMELLVTWDGSVGDTEEVLITEPLPVGKDKVAEKGWYVSHAIKPKECANHVVRNITRIPTAADMDDPDEGAASVLAITYGMGYWSPEEYPDVYGNIAALAQGDVYNVIPDTFGGDPEPRVKKSATVFYTRGLSPIFVHGAFDYGNIVFED
jgi:hypothetical protein